MALKGYANIDAATDKLLASQLPTGTGTVTDVSVTTANGVSGTVATSTTTPAITLTLGAITPSSVTSTGAIESKTSIILEDPGAGTNTATIQAPTLAGSYTLTLPTTDGTPSQVLTTDGSGVLSWTTPAGTGDVVGPGSATDNAISRFDGVTGKLIQNSVVTVSDTGDIVGVGANLIGTVNVALTVSVPDQTVATTAGVGINIHSDGGGDGGGGNAAGAGGALLLKGGIGGDAVGAGEFGGAGGTATLQGGTSGAASAGEVTDNGGAVFILGGTGGAGSAGIISGNGGDATLQPGSPGASGGAGTGSYGSFFILSGDGILGVSFNGLTNKWTHNIKDNAGESYLVRESTHNYIDVSTSNGTESVNFGNATTNPTYGFLGSGSFSFPSGSAILIGRLLEKMGASVAAANDLTLGTDGNCFEITGNTQINAIATNQWQAGALITLGFAGTPTVKHNTAGGAGFQKIFLANGADFVASANDTLTLRYMVIGAVNGWYEVARTTI